MFKKFLFALIPACLLASSAFAGDDLLDISASDLTTISDASAELQDLDLASLNVEALTADAGEKGEDAIEACFRRFNYCGGYGGYNYGCYSHCYNTCYNYSYCYPTYYCYRPLYTCAMPIVYSYWGCY